MSTSTILVVMAACALGLVLIAIVARLNDADEEADGPPTILIEAPEEPLGDQVDVGAIIRRYGD